MGPWSLWLAGLLRHVGPNDGQYAATVVIAALGLGAIWFVEAAARGREAWANDRTAVVTLVGGVVVLTAWAQVSGRYTHIDDGLALFAWAVGLVPLVLVFRGRRALLAAVWAGVVLGLAWGPFLVADHATSGELARWFLPTHYGSSINALGIHRISNHALWRIFQFGAEAAVVAALVWLGEWRAALLACIATRLLLDPYAWPYYAAGVALGALFFDVAVWRRAVPAMTAVSLVAVLSYSESIHRLETRGEIRLVLYVALIAAAFTVAVWRRSGGGVVGGVAGDGPVGLGEAHDGGDDERGRGRGGGGGGFAEGGERREVPAGCVRPVDDVGEPAEEGEAEGAEEGPQRGVGGGA
jgi:hypothetical protein